MNKKIIKLSLIVIGIILLIALIIFLIIKLVPSKQKQNGEITLLECTIKGKKYKYEIEDSDITVDEVDSLKTNDKDLKVDYTDYSKVVWLVQDIKNEIKTRGGSCK